MVSKNPKKPMTFYVRLDQLKALHKLAASLDRSIGDLIREGIQFIIAKYNG